MFRYLVLLAAIAGCGPKAIEPWEGPTTSTGPTEEVDVPALGVFLLVPTGTDVVHTGAGATFYTQPGVAHGRAFSVEHGEPALLHPEEPVGRHERTLKNGSVVRYSVRVAGADAFLDGAIVVDQNVFAVHCHDTAEPPAKPAAEWCLQWLATLDTPK